MSFENFCFFLTVDGKLWSGGENGQGMCGNGDKAIFEASLSEVFKDENIKKITCGKTHTLLLLRGGDLYVTGSNRMNQLGNAKVRSPTKFTLAMTGIEDIACGAFFSFVFLKNGEVKGFGDNEKGQLGVGNYDEVEIPTVVITDNTVKQICCGSFHTLILFASGKVLGSGSNEKGQLALSEDIKRVCTFTPIVENLGNVEMIATSSLHSLIYCRNQELYSFGDNFNYQIGVEEWGQTFYKPQLIMKDVEIEQISCGVTHCFVLTKSKELFSWGDASNKLGRTRGYGISKECCPMVALKDENLVQVYCAADFTIALMKTGECFAVGRGIITGGYWETAENWEKMDFAGNVCLLPGKTRTFSWNFDSHIDFDDAIRLRVYTFVLCLSRFHSFKIPKPIFKLIVNLFL